MAQGQGFGAKPGDSGGEHQQPAGSLFQRHIPAPALGGGSGRLKSSRWTAQARAATALQSAWRAKLERAFFADALGAAIRIQSVLRGRMARAKAREAAEQRRRPKRGKKGARGGGGGGRVQPPAEAVEKPRARKKTKTAPQVGKASREGVGVVEANNTAARGASSADQRVAQVKEGEEKAAAAAAARIQAVMRGHLRRKSDERGRQLAACAKIQAAARGMLARRQAAATPPVQTEQRVGRKARGPWGQASRARGPASPAKRLPATGGKPAKPKPILKKRLG